MRIENWMSRTVVTCRPDDDLGDAARKMWEHDCGALPVVDGSGCVVAMLTDRDALMGTLHAGRAPRELRVRDSMSPRVHTCLASDSIEDVIRTMGDRRIRRIPVVDRAGRLVGIVALGDLVRGLVSMLEIEERHRLSTRLVEALACVSEPHRPGNEDLETLSPAPREAKTGPAKPRREPAKGRAR